MATELSALVDAGTIRVIDALTLTKDDDGTTAGVLIWETCGRYRSRAAAQKAKIVDP